MKEDDEVCIYNLIYILDYGPLHLKQTTVKSWINTPASFRQSAIGLHMFVCSRLRERHRRPLSASSRTHTYNWVLYRETMTGGRNEREMLFERERETRLEARRKGKEGAWQFKVRKHLRMMEQQNNVSFYIDFVLRFLSSLLPCLSRYFQWHNKNVGELI